MWAKDVKHRLIFLSLAQNTRTLRILVFHFLDLLNFVLKKHIAVIYELFFYTLKRMLKNIRKKYVKNGHFAISCCTSVLFYRHRKTAEKHQFCIKKFGTALNQETDKKSSYFLYEFRMRNVPGILLEGMFLKIMTWTQQVMKNNKISWISRMLWKNQATFKKQDLGRGELGGLKESWNCNCNLLCRLKFQFIPLECSSDL